MKETALYRYKGEVEVVKKGNFYLSEEEKVFIREEAKKFGISVPENRDVENALNLYLKDRRNVELALRRARLYAPYIRPVLEEYGLPEEFTLLPLIESGFNPFAISPSGAGGLWQIMPATGRRFGLRVDEKVDERFDLVKSTHAAARYLKELYETFGNWELVLAAYNCGEGCVLRRTGGGDFWKTKWALPEQTRKYVPMFFAALLVAKSPQKYGLAIEGNSLPLSVKVAESNLSVEELLRREGVKESTFRDLNPHIKGSHIPAGVYVYLPSAPEPEGSERIRVVRLENGALLYIKE